MQTAPFFIMIYVASMAFPALDSIIKEKLFGDARCPPATTAPADH